MTSCALWIYNSYRETVEYHVRADKGNDKIKLVEQRALLFQFEPGPKDRVSTIPYQTGISAFHIISGDVTSQNPRKLTIVIVKNLTRDFYFFLFCFFLTFSQISGSERSISTSVPTVFEKENYCTLNSLPAGVTEIYSWDSFSMIFGARE